MYTNTPPRRSNGQNATSGAQIWLKSGSLKNSSNPPYIGTRVGGSNFKSGERDRMCSLRVIPSSMDAALSTKDGYYGEI